MVAQKNYKRGTCIRHGCAGLVQARKLCGPHYREWRASLTIEDIQLNKPPACAVPGCARLHHHAGLCAKHHAALARGAA